MTQRAAEALLLAALAAGCATAPPAMPGQPAVAGRLALSVAALAGQPARGFSASFELRGDAQSGELRLSAVLGPQIAAARWAPGRVRLQTGDGERDYPDLAALAQDTLGEPVPLQALPHWLRGQPWPGAATQASAQGFEQLGWALDLSRQAEGVIIAVRARPPAVTLRIRLDDPPT